MLVRFVLVFLLEKSPKPDCPVQNRTPVNPNGTMSNEGVGRLVKSCTRNLFK